MKVTLLAVIVVCCGSSCFDYAVPLADRKKLVSNTSSDRPLGIWNIYGQKFQVDTPIALVQILVEEILGYETFVNARGTGEIGDAFYALAGCNQPENKTNQSCTGRATRHHISTGLHVSNNISRIHFERVQRLRMGGMLEDLGSVGFVSQSGLQISSLTVQRALEDPDPLFLDDFRNYDARYHNPQRFFIRHDEIDEELLIPCSQWTFDPSENLFMYAARTMDWAPILRDDANQPQLQCRGRWFLTPSCRGAGRCIPCIAPSNDGNEATFATEIMQKAALWNMPLAVGLALYDGNSAYRELILRYRHLLFMFWEPSVELRRISPVFVRFPAHNATQWSNAIMASTREGEFPRHMVSYELAELAPDVRVLMQRAKFSLEAINQMIIWSDENNTATKCFPCAAWYGACTWLQQNKDTWNAWIPQVDACFAGQGMYSVADSAFVSNRSKENRSAAVECRACPAGRYSALVSDHSGDTAECRVCPAGSSQRSQSSVQCEPCAAGTYSDQEEMVECLLCPEGFFQNMTFATGCQQCPMGMTTMMLGAPSSDLCQCKAGWYEIDFGVCAECPMGLTCLGGADHPQQEAGYWASVTYKAAVGGADGMGSPVYTSTSQVPYTSSTSQAPSTGQGQSLNFAIASGSTTTAPWFFASTTQPQQLFVSSVSVFGCRDRLQCPGGVLGSCAPGRKGRACGRCKQGHAPEFDGSCAACGGRSLWPILVMLLVTLGAIPLILVAGLFVARARRAALSLFMVSIIFGQVVVCLQALDAIYQLDITWIDPAKAILQSMAIFNLDLDFSCVLPPQDYVLEYVVQLTAYPAVLLGSFLVWLAMKGVAGQQVTFNAFVNVHGLLLVALLTGMTLMIVRPLQCKNNPNGLFTIASRPDIICWESSEHQTLVALAIAGIVAYPVTILVSIAYLTRQYPIWLRSGGGIEVMERYRFLFARFRPERYYYGLILSLHNLIVAVIPAALVSFPALQVGFMGIVICVKMIIQILIWPWRLEVANYNDLALSAGLLILLLLASPLLDLSQEETLTFVAILLSSVMVILPVVALFAALAVVFSRLRPQSKYAAFLCHHKAGAGALCRFFKLVAKKYVNMNIFLDSDELDDLARIFDVVRADTKCLVVVLTSELLNRMWCAGEIASAHKNQVPIVPLYCDDYAFPDHDSIDVVESAWTEEQRQTLVSYGISMDDIKAAYKFVASLHGIDLKRAWSLEAQEDAVLHVITVLYDKVGRIAEVAHPPATSSAKILVCAADTPEATSTGFILQQMVQRNLRSFTFLIREPSQVAASTATFALVILSHQILEDAAFAQTLLALRKAEISIVSINDGSFEFPSMEFYTQVEEGNLMIKGLEPNLGPAIARAYQALLSILALPLTPHGSMGILERQVSQICQRFGNWEDVEERLMSKKSVDSGEKKSGESESEDAEIQESEDSIPSEIA